MNIQHTQQNTIWHAANAAKALHIISTTAGVVGGVFSTQEFFEEKIGTPTQIATFAFPLIIITGRAIRLAYEKCRGRKITRWNPVPAPFCIGLGIGVGSIAMKIGASDCNYLHMCPNYTSSFFSECQKTLNACHEMLNSPDAWGPYSTWGTNQYCDSDCINWENGCDVFDLKSTAISDLCSRILQAGKGPGNMVCGGAWNLQQESIDNITLLQEQLFNTTRCTLNEDQINGWYKNATELGIYSYLGAFACIIAHPLFWNPNIRPLYINPIINEDDPLLSLMGDKVEKPVKMEKITNYLTFFLENV